MPTRRNTTLYGQLGVFGLPTVLSALNMQKVTGYLTLVQTDRAAEIVVSNGEVVDAWDKTERGLDLLLKLFTWDSGVFSFSPRPAETRTIDMALPALLVRAAVFVDEYKKRRASPGHTPEALTGRQVFSLNREVSREVTLRPEHWPVIRQLVAGPASLEAIAQQSDFPLERLVPVVTQLMRANLLRSYTPPAPDE